MGRTTGTALMVMTAAAACAGCASTSTQIASSNPATAAPVAVSTAAVEIPAAPEPAGPMHAAGVGVYAVRTTSVNLYHGAGRAIKAPLHDLNMMQDQIAPVLLRAEDHPYDLSGVDSCNDVLDKVGELDLSLGPDVDTPKEHRRTKASRGADFAAGAALDAAGSAVEHFIPMRGTIKQVTGATRYENHVRHAVMAGEVRRSFLKAVGMAHNCTWPAAPLNFHATQVADVNASWTGATGVQYASAALAQPAAQAEVLDRSPVSVRTYAILTIPPAVAPAPSAAQSWTPPAAHASARSGVMAVSAPMTAAAAAPWGAGFASAH